MPETLTEEMEAASVIHMASEAFLAEARDDPGERRIRKAIIAACIATRSGTPDEDEGDSVVVEGQAAS